MNLGFSLDLPIARGHQVPATVTYSACGDIEAVRPLFPTRPLGEEVGEIIRLYRRTLVVQRKAVRLHFIKPDRLCWSFSFKYQDGRSDA